MTSIQPTEQTLTRSHTLDSVPTSLIRFNSARIGPEKTEKDIEDLIESRPTSPLPLDRHLDEGLLQSNDFSPQSPIIKHKIHSTSRIAPLANENDSNRVLKISEYHAPENTPFEPLSTQASPKKLHSYILLTPCTIFSMSLLTILSLVVVIIGFGVAVARRQSQLNDHCSLISYCPQNTSYTVLCNMTTEYCHCYNTEDTLIGCIKQRQYGEGCYRTQECSVHHNLQCNMSIYQCQCLGHYYYNV
jgi:hypothetical protein